MDEILLTGKEILQETERVCDAFEALPRDEQDSVSLLATVQRALCRAQVRKVVEWMEKHSYWEDKIHLIVSLGTMQALRAAAEEVRG